MPYALPILVAIAVISYLAYQQYQAYLSLKAFGGHWSAGWSRLWLLRAQSSGQMHRHFIDLNRKYGSTARIGPKMLITSDPALVRTMNAVRSSFTRGGWYAALKLHPDFDNITSYTDERTHADVRARMAPGYSGKENKHLEQDVDDQLLDLFELLDRKYVAQPDKGIFRTADMSRVSTFFTLDVISQVAFGRKFGFLANDEDPYGYQENLMAMLPAIILFGVYTELTKLLKIPFIKAAMPSSTDPRGLGAVMGFAKQRVDERFGEKAVVRKDMLGSFIRKGIPQLQLESETLTQITAGSDSTASALRLTLYLICISPLVQARVLNEAREALSKGRMSRPVIKDSEARNLPYLQACIKESLRVYPPVSGLLAKQVPPEGYEIDVDGVKKFAPAGTQIAWNIYGIMLDKSIFGEDVEVFRPERWLPRDNSESETTRVTRMTDTVGLCFGYGRFGCLGRGVATMELNKAVIETLLRYNLQPCNTAKPFDEQVIGFTVHTNMNFVLTPRVEGEEKLAGDATYGEPIALPGAYEE